jgi:hypothetical protein
MTLMKFSARANWFSKMPNPAPAALSIHAEKERSMSYSARGLRGALIPASLGPTEQRHNRAVQERSGL